MVKPLIEGNVIMHLIQNTLEMHGLSHLTRCLFVTSEV
jgi:hypothetical protein